MTFREQWLVPATSSPPTFSVLAKVRSNKALDRFKIAIVNASRRQKPCRAGLPSDVEIPLSSGAKLQADTYPATTSEVPQTLPTLSGRHAARSGVDLSGTKPKDREHQGSCYTQSIQRVRAPTTGLLLLVLRRHCTLSVHLVTETTEWSESEL